MHFPITTNTSPSQRTYESQGYPDGKGAHTPDDVRKQLELLLMFSDFTIIVTVSWVVVWYVYQFMIPCLWAVYAMVLWGASK